MSPRRIRDLLPFQPDYLASGSGWPVGVVAERYVDVGPFQVTLPPSTHHWLTLLSPCRTSDVAPQVTWCIGREQISTSLTRSIICFAPAGSDQRWASAGGTLTCFNLLTPEQSTVSLFGGNVVQPVGLLEQACVERRALSRLMLQLSKELGRDGPESERIRNSLLDAIGGYLCRAQRQVAQEHSVDAATTASLTGVQIRQIHDYIVDNLRSVTIGDLADVVGCSRRSFSRHFRSSTGQTGSQIIRHLRVARLLEAFQVCPNQKVDAVADEVGFGSRAHLARNLKETTGYTVAQLRKHFRTGHGLKVIRDHAASKPNLAGNGPDMA